MYRLIKRFLDIIIALNFIIITFPVMILTAIAIKIESPRSNIIFKQLRCGKDEIPFKIYKFRSMIDEAPDALSTEDFDNSNLYISKVGRVIRLASIDELPQLFNILKGEMSFIGPRPVILEEKKLIEERSRLGIYKIKPGLTGYAQINGRDELSIEEKVKLDKYYLDNLSFHLDLKIFILTIPSIIFSKGHKESK